MHPYVRGSHRAKIDDDDFNFFRGIACEGYTHTHTHTHGLSHKQKQAKKQRLNVDDVQSRNVDDITCKVIK